jgi:beta-glucuronidase
LRETLSLNGFWKFCPAFIELEANQRFMNHDFDPDAPGEATAEPGAWVNSGYDDRGWMDVPVPASWNKAVPDLWSYEGHGWYRTEIRVPAAWEGRRVAFRSDGANYKAILYVNGKKAGEHESGYTPFSIPIHSFLEPGKDNTIALSVDNIPARERCPGGQFDWWNHGGLYRPVCLEVTDTCYLDDVVVVTEPGDPTSTVEVRASVTAETGTPRGMTLAAVLRDAGGVEVAADSAPVAISGTSGEATLALVVEKALLWTPDEPNLYSLCVELRNAAGTRLDTCRRRVGIRSIRVEGTKLLLNGEPFVVKGFSRYEDYADTGRTPNELACRHDVQLVKEMGGNTIRSHIPYSPETYDICDEMGLFCVTEVPLYQWGRPLVLTDSDEALGAAKAQLREIITWQRSHPSVLMWSVSNENMCKPREDTPKHRELADMVVQGNMELVDMAHDMDPTRPVIEISNCWPGDRVFEKTDICAVNVYIGASTPHVDTVGELAEEMHRRFDALRAEWPDKPILVGEFGSWCVRGLKTDHFPGEPYQAALLRTYWEAMAQEKNVVGGLVWAFADSDVHRRFEWVYEYRCAYGVFDINRNPKDAVRTLTALWNTPRDTPKT